MSVTAGPTFKRYAANGVATVYSIPFLVLDAVDLLITLNGVTVTSGFTLSGVGTNPTASCTFAVAPTGDLLFQQVVTFQRLSDYQNNGDLLSETVNRDLDRLWLAIKQISRDIGRAITVSTLELDGIPPLSAAGSRKGRMLGFNSDGNPVPSNLTIEQIEQQPAQAAAAAEVALASASVATESATAASGSASAAARSAAALNGAAVPMFAVEWWPGLRSAIPLGRFPADGQTIQRSLIPDAVAAMAASVPIVADADWISDVTKRASYTMGDGATTIRLPDYNGKYAGSLGAVFMRGDGTSGLSAGAIKRDQIQNITGSVSSDTNVGLIRPTGVTTGAFKKSVTSKSSWMNTTTSSGTLDLEFDASGSARTGTETFPTHAIGCWVIRLYGAVLPTGGLDLSQVSTRLTTVESKVAVLEPKVAALEARQKAIGDGQTWQDVSASRVFGTTYTNTTGRAIMLCVNLFVGAGVSMLGYVNGALISHQYSSGFGQYSIGGLIVPAGATYRISASGTIVSSAWNELRE